MDYDGVMFIQIQWFMLTWCLIETRQTWFRGGLRHPETGLTFWARSWFGLCVGHTSDARGGAGHGEWTGYGQLAKGWLCMAQVPAYGNIAKPTLCEFTGSGWGLWSRKWMLYKLGTQENLATNIKPIWGTLEKWQPPRSAFSKLWIVFFLRKTSPCLNCIMLKFRNHFFLKTTSGEWFSFSKAQHPTHRIFRIIRISSKFHPFPSHFHPTKLPLNFD